MLQDSFDQIQAETKFEADQSRQQLQNREQEIEQLKAQLMVRIFTLNNVYIFIQNYKLSSFIYLFIYNSGSEQLFTKRARTHQLPDVPVGKQREYIQVSSPTIHMNIKQCFSTLGL